MAFEVHNTPARRTATHALLAHEQLYDQRVPGVMVVAQVLERGRLAGRLPPAGFWSSRLARHAATLLAAQHTPGRCPTSADLDRIGLHDAARAVTNAELSRYAAALGLLH